MEKLRIGIVGTGQRICYHGGCVFWESRENRPVSDLIEIAALCEVKPDRLAHAKRVYEERFGYEIAAYEDYRKMYAEANLDAVYVAGPNDLHRDMTVPALERGLHVLCEKPMEVTLAKCDEMILAAKKANRILAFGMQMHYRERYHKVREMIDDGLIGKPAMLWCTEYRATFHVMKDWVWDPKKSGGAIVEKNCHHYDILNLWVQSEPTTVYASGNIMKHDAPGGTPSGIVDNAWVINNYACGARAMLGICFLADPGIGHKREFGVIGTEGQVKFDLEDAETLHVRRNTGEEIEIRNPNILRGGLFHDFAESVRTGRQPLVTAEMARASVLVPLAAEKSIVEKRVVHVSELI